MGLSDVPADQLLAWVTASTEAQGLSVRVTDPATVERVRALLTGGAPRPVPARGARPRDGARLRSDAPDRLNAGDVERSAAGRCGGMDDDVVDDRLDDRGLPGQVQAGPALP